MTASERVRAWRLANPEKWRAQKAKYEADHAEELALKRRTRRLARYGLTPTQYDALLADQGEVCAICRNPQAKGGGSLHVDHCHTTGRVRGLLCSDCNRAIGLLGDDPVRCARAGAYLV